MLKFRQENPLIFILLIAAFVRVVAAVFSGGYAMHDDHFLVVEVAQSWVDGKDVYGWVTSTKETNTSGRSLFYPGIVAGLFWLLEQAGFDPLVKMFVLRLLQAFYSLLTVYYAYKIAQHWSDTQRASEVGWVLALLWLMPYISVRTLAEVVCIPPLMAATWLIVDPEKKQKWAWAFWAGVLVGIAFSLRYQTLLYGAGLGIGLLWWRRWKDTIWFAFGLAVWIALMHGWVEWYAWGYPFGKIEYYVRYNLVNKDAYFHHPWYNYLLLLPGLLFPLGLLYAWGVFRKGYRHLPMFAGFIIFLLFHSTLPNKQERFMFTMIPAFVVLGAMGWHLWTSSSAFWQKRKGLERGIRISFWALNAVALLVFSTYYPKQGRVEAMYGVGKMMGTNKITADSNAQRLPWLLVADGRADHPAPVPRFYCGAWQEVVSYGKNDDPNGLLESVADHYGALNLALVVENEEANQTVAELQQVFPGMTLIRTYESNAFDRFLHWLNPLNRTESMRLYRLKPE